MRSFKSALMVVAAVFSTSALAEDSLMKQAQGLFKPIPSIVPSLKHNAVTREKVELGKLLFFDPRISSSEIISCNTCHNLGTGGVGGLAFGQGEGEVLALADGGDASEADFAQCVLDGLALGVQDGCLQRDIDMCLH